MPFRVFSDGEVLTAAYVNDYLMEQAVITCTSGTRPSSPTNGMVIYETDAQPMNRIKHWDSTAASWRSQHETPLVKLLLPGNQAIPNNTATALSFGASSQSILTHAGFHSTSTNPSRITPNISGYYKLTLHALWAPNPTGDRRIYIAKNGTLLQPLARLGTVPSLSVSHQVISTLAANGSTDYFGAFVFHTSGGSLDCTGSSVETDTFGTTFECQFVRPL